MSSLVTQYFDIFLHYESSKSKGLPPVAIIKYSAVILPRELEGFPYKN